MSLTTITWITCCLMAFFLGGMFTKYFILYGLDKDIKENVAALETNRSTPLNDEYTVKKIYAFNYILENRFLIYLK